MREKEEAQNPKDGCAEMLPGGEEGRINASTHKRAENAGGSQPEVTKQNAQSISGSLASRCVRKEAKRTGGSHREPASP